MKSLKTTLPGPRVNLQNTNNLSSAKISSTRDRLLLEYMKKGARKRSKALWLCFLVWVAVFKVLGVPVQGQAVSYECPLCPYLKIAHSPIALVRTPNTVSQPFARILGIYRRHYSIWIYKDWDKNVCVCLHVCNTFFKVRVRLICALISHFSLRLFSTIMRKGTFYELWTRVMF